MSSLYTIFGNNITSKTMLIYVLYDSNTQLFFKPKGYSLYYNIEEDFQCDDIHKANHYKSKRNAIDLAAAFHLGGLSEVRVAEYRVDLVKTNSNISTDLEPDSVDVKVIQREVDRVLNMTDSEYDKLSKRERARHKRRMRFLKTGDISQLRDPIFG